MAAVVPNRRQWSGQEIIMRTCSLHEAFVLSPSTTTFSFGLPPGRRSTVFSFLFSQMSVRTLSPPPVYDSAMSTSLKPYLELPHLLSLAWIAYPILSLLFVVFRLQSSADSAESSIASAKENLLASCRAAERAASSTASFPRYMALAANQQFTDSVNGTLNGARAALVLTLTVMEGIINFLVDIYRSTFLCFLELIVRGALSILISATQEVRRLHRSSFSSRSSDCPHRSPTSSRAPSETSGRPFRTTSLPSTTLSRLPSTGSTMSIPSRISPLLSSLSLLWMGFRTSRFLMISLRR